MKLDKAQEYICQQQEDLFRYALIHGSDIKNFIEKFMNSKFCEKSIDRRYSPEQFSNILDWFFYLNQEGIYLDKNENKHKEFSQDFICWVGSMYRRIQIENRLSSAEIYEYLPFSVLYATYEGLHTVDDSVASKTLFEYLNKNKANKLSNPQKTLLKS